MSREFSLPLFRELVNTYSNRNITSVVMDQEVISGCGNYIKAEVLYYAKISPLRKIGSLSNREIELLFEGLRIIPRISYNQWDLIIKDCNDGDEDCHYHTKDLKVYGKIDAKQTKTPDGRITYWYPKVQQ